MLNMITTGEFHKITTENVANFKTRLKLRLKQANLVSKAQFDGKLINFNRTITSNKTKYLEVQKN